jgi:hypothetical protein
MVLYMQNFSWKTQQRRADMNRDLLKWVCTGVVATLGVSAWSQVPPSIIISTFNNYDGQSFGLSNGQSIGQDITLNAANYNLTGFEIEYAVPGNFLAANVGVNISFYNVNSAGAPTTIFYNSGYFYNTYDSPDGYIPASASGNDLLYGNADFDAGDGDGSMTLYPGYLMPTQFLFSIEFTNISPNQVTLPIATNNNTYASTVANDYWVDNNGAWSEFTNAVGNNVLFSFTGVPEPTVFALSGVGSLMLFGAMKLKRKR